MSHLADNLNAAIDNLGGAITLAIDTLKQQAEIEQSIARLNDLTAKLRTALQPQKLEVTTIPPFGEAPTTTMKVEVMPSASTAIEILETSRHHEQNAAAPPSEDVQMTPQDDSSQPTVEYIDLSTKPPCTSTVAEPSTPIMEIGTPPAEPDSAEPDSAMPPPDASAQHEPCHAA